MLTALIAFQESAKPRDADAFTAKVSYYKKGENRNANQYQCHAGNILSGVALKGRYAKFASK